MSFWNSLAFQQLPEAREEPTHTTQISRPLKITLPYSHQANCHWPIRTCSCPILWSVVWVFLFGWVFVWWVVGFCWGFCVRGCWFWFLHQVVLGINLNTLVTLTVFILKRKKNTSTVLHFSGLVSSLGFNISGYGVFVDCSSEKHPIMLLVLIISPIRLVWRFLPANTEYHSLVHSIIFNFKTGIIYFCVELK